MSFYGMGSDRLFLVKIDLYIETEEALEKIDGNYY